MHFCLSSLYAPIRVILICLIIVIAVAFYLFYSPDLKYASEQNEQPCQQNERQPTSVHAGNLQQDETLIF